MSAMRGRWKAAALALALGLVAIWWGLVAGDMRRFETLSPGLAPADLAARLDARLDHAMAEYGIRGAAAGAMVDGQWIWSARRGVRNAQGDPVGGATAFNLGSVSKPLAVWAVLALAEEGRIDLDAPIATYLTRWTFPETPYAVEAVTVRRVLQHAAGLSIHGYAGYEYYETPPADIAEQARTGYPIRQTGPAGMAFRYSGGGYSLLQMMIEDVTGQPYERWLGERVLTPLGLTGSGAGSWAPARPSAAFNAAGEEIETLRYLALAATGSWMSGDDMEAFLSAHLDGGGVLSPAILAGTFAASEVSERRATGYTREMSPAGPILGHGGNNSTWHAQIYVRPQTGDGFYFLTNTTTGAQLGLDLGCAWRSWALGQTARDVCAEERALVHRLSFAAGLVGSLAILVGVRLAAGLAGGTRHLRWHPRSGGPFGMAGRAVSLVLLAGLAAVCVIVFYTNAIYWREGVVFIDEIPLDEVEWLLPAILALLATGLLDVWAGPADRAPATKKARP